MTLLKHQLFVHLDDYGPHEPTRRVEIRYSYPHTRPHSLREQVLVLSDTEITDDFRRQLDFIYRALEGRIPVPASVRLPHAEVMPTVQAGILTFVAVDQSRSDEIPLARLYFNEDVAALRSRVEGQVRVTRHEWAGHEQAVCQR